MAVKQFFRWLDQENIYPNIAKNIKGVRLDNSLFKKDYLTTSQVKTMLNSIDRTTIKGKRDYAILLLMVTTGLRTIEVARADLEDLRTVGNFTALFIQGKGKTDRAEFVKVVPAVEQALREYLACRGMDNARDTDPLFSSIANRNDGERMTTRSISRICKEHMIDANLISSRLTAHSLRHTSATLNLLNGGSLEETRQLLRHSNISTTMIYAHSLERAKNDSENRIAQAIL
jgi:integrase/recombinase XerC